MAPNQEHDQESWPKSTPGQLGRLLELEVARLLNLCRYTTVLNHPPEIKKVRNDLKSVPKVLVLVILENQSAQIGPLGVFEK